LLALVRARYSTYTTKQPIIPVLHGAIVTWSPVEEEELRSAPPPPPTKSLKYSYINWLGEGKRAKLFPSPNQFIHEYFALDGGGGGRSERSSSSSTSSSVEQSYFYALPIILYLMRLGWEGRASLASFPSQPHRVQDNL